MMRPVKIAPTFDAAMDRLSRAVAMVADGFAAEDNELVQQGFAEFDAAVEEAVAAL